MGFFMVSLAFFFGRVFGLLMGFQWVFNGLFIGFCWVLLCFSSSLAFTGVLMGSLWGFYPPILGEALALGDSV